MLPFSRQVLIACDAAKNGVARIAGVDAPKFEDNETTLPELKARIRKTLDFLATVPASQLDGTEDRRSPSGGRDATRTLTARAYLTHWMLPNFFFHVTIAYAILRHNGVDLGKTDYLMGAQQAELSGAASWSDSGREPHSVARPGPAALRCA
jgi:hypothetical protein